MAYAQYLIVRALSAACGMRVAGIGIECCFLAFITIYQWHIQ